MKNMGCAFSALENRTLQEFLPQEVLTRQIGSDTADSVGDENWNGKELVKEFETTGKRLPATSGILVINGIDRRKMSLEGSLASYPASLILSKIDGELK